MHNAKRLSYTCKKYKMLILRFCYRYVLILQKTEMFESICLGYFIFIDASTAIIECGAIYLVELYLLYPSMYTHLRYQHFTTILHVTYLTQKVKRNLLLVKLCGYQYLAFFFENKCRTNRNLFVSGVAKTDGTPGKIFLPLSHTNISEKSINGRT